MNSEVRACKKCRKLYNFRGNVLCPECVQKLDDNFNAVKNYLYAHPSCTLTDIADSTGAEETDIVAWLKEGRLVTTMDFPDLLTCETCGTPIKQGRYCTTCGEKLRQTLLKSVGNTTVKAPAPKTTFGRDSSDKMHTKR